MLKRFKESFEARSSEARQRGEEADDWTDYWEKMRKDKEWGDAVFLQATAWYLYSDIIIVPTSATKEHLYYTISGNFKTEGRPCPGPPLLLGYNNGVHYQSLLLRHEKQEQPRVLNPMKLSEVLEGVKVSPREEASGEMDDDSHLLVVITGCPIFVCQEITCNENSRCPVA